MNKEILVVKNLTKTYKSKGFFRQEIYNRAVDQISFSLEDGCITGMIGESGCGKSTVGKLILNLLHPDGGRAEYRGRVLFDVEQKINLPARQMRELRREMQMIFQDPFSCLDPRKNVEQIINEGIKKFHICSVPERRGYCAHVMEMCGLEAKQMMKYPHEFSGGQRQRIGIARALALNPKFVICDEPTAALDMSIQSQILNLMLDMKEQYKLTYLFISHNLGIVRHFCDYIIIMYLGKIVEEGDGQEIFARPYHPYTKLLLASEPAAHPSNRKERILNYGKCDEIAGIRGCKFADRCPYKTKICREQEPELRRIGTKHLTACHYEF